MPITITPVTRPRVNIIEHYLATLDNAEREDALRYLEHPDVYEHQALAEALSNELGYSVSEASVRRWRRKHLSSARGSAQRR